MQQEIESYKSADWLYSQYWVKRLSGLEMADQCSVNDQTIYNWMDRFNLARRTLSEAFRGRKCHDEWKENVRISKNKQFPIEKYRYKDKEWLYDQYITQGKTSIQIAKENCFGKSIICLWLKRFGIKARRGLPGSNHPNWKGGSLKYYSNLARKVWEEWNERKLPEGWEIHHMDYDITNNAIWNLLAVTKSEHAKIHSKGQRLTEWCKKYRWKKYKEKYSQGVYQYA